MILPNGVTGFFDSVDTPQTKVNGKQFKQICITIAIHNGGKIIAFKEPEYPMNFYSVYVEFFNKQFHILLNEYYPNLAFASIVEFGNIEFIDIPILYKQFNPFYKVLNTSELNNPVTLINSSKKSIIQNNNELNSTELKEIVFWKLKTVGEIIFNYWD
ncbi:hypothetical protein [Bacillus sp. JJ722]|uniref:hypothetical protein n=1 Tax=Bacillus sp. JJ722 TaxID=3122973 RepID=UPI002FFF6127